jgi:hypothetical protein
VAGHQSPRYNDISCRSRGENGGEMGSAHCHLGRKRKGGLAGQ